MSSSALTPLPLIDLSCIHTPLQAEIQAAIQTVIETGQFILGPALAEFETAFAAASQAAYGVGMGTGTEAIALGLHACGIRPGDEVILPANTFVATLIGVLRSGATPVFVDCDADTALIDLSATEKAITPKTRAIVPVHLYGQMVAPGALLDLASTYDVLIFEDAAQAHLATRDGYCAGSVGVAAAFSFYPGKNLGALGDGGMLLTQHEAIAQTGRALRNYGAAKKYYHTEPMGTNSRLDALQAAVLHVKLPYLAGWNHERNRLAKLYDRLLAPLRSQGIVPIQNVSGEGHVYHLYVIQLQPDCPISRDHLQTYLAEQGISTGIHYPIPCHLQPAFLELGYEAGSFPQAERLCRSIISLPMFPGLHDHQVERVVAAIQAAIAAIPQPLQASS